MVEQLSPGVKIEEIDGSTIVPQVSNSIAVFAGDFNKGPIEAYLLITNVDELIEFFGYPDDSNYNSWFQVYNFLQYGNKVYVARAAGVNAFNAGALAVQSGGSIGTYTPELIKNNNDFELNKTDEASHLKFIARNPGTWANDITIAIANPSDFGNDYYALPNVELDDLFEYVPETGQIAIVVAEAGTVVETFRVSLTPGSKDYKNKSNYIEDVINNQSEYVFVTDATDGTVESYVAGLFDPDDTGGLDATDIANYGTATNGDTEIISFSPAYEVTEVTAEADSSGSLNNAYWRLSSPDTDYYVWYNVNSGGVDPDPDGGDSTGIEVQIATDAVNTAVASATADAIDALSDFSANAIDEVITITNTNYGNTTDAADGDTGWTDAWTVTQQGILGGVDDIPEAGDLTTAYDLWSNKEELDVDIVIGNEIDFGISAKNLCDTRADCMGFIGAEYVDVVGKKASVAVSNLVTWRTTGNLNFNSMFVVSAANYKYQYDRYNDKNRWINIAGDIAGLRAQTNITRASWWASAGLERGQIRNVKKLAFNPNQAQRDILYKNGLNPIVSFPGQGTVMWGQKTLLSTPSSFDRANIRGLFNTLERSLSKMAKYQVMNFNDTFTRNRIVSMIKPFLSSVQAGRGIQDYLVICDTTNNTPAVIQANRLIVDVYIKPTYVAEFILLRFTNAGTNSFAEIVGA